MIPYLILSPKNLIRVKEYKSKSAGVRVLEKLYRELNKRGYEAYLTDGYNTPEVNGTVEKTVELIERGAITVYHENIPSNVMRSVRPVGYVLGEWHRQRQNTFCKETFYYHPSLGEGKQLKINVIERELFHNLDRLDRLCSCTWVGKGDIGGFIGVDIDNPKDITTAWPDNRYDLAMLLKGSKALYTTDGNSALSTEARLCGCPVVFLPNQAFTWKQCQAFNVGTPSGIGLTLEEAQATLPNFQAEYDKAWDSEREVSEIDDFISITQKMEAQCL